MAKWSDEHAEMARTLVITDGMPAEQAALKLTRDTKIHRTRNSVIGILHRKGWAVGNDERVRRGRAATQSRRQAKAAKGAKSGPAFNQMPAAADFKKLKANQDAGFLRLLAADRVAVPPEGSQGLLVMDKGKLIANPAMHDRACRWPVGDPLVHRACFCAKRTIAPGAPYCESHASRAYSVAQPRRAAPTVSAAPETETAAGDASTRVLDGVT